MPVASLVHRTTISGLSACLTSQSATVVSSEQVAKVRVSRNLHPRDPVYVNVFNSLYIRFIIKKTVYVRNYYESYKLFFRIRSRTGIKFVPEHQLAPGFGPLKQIHTKEV
jgi:hypothetical protein